MFLNFADVIDIVILVSQAMEGEFMSFKMETGRISLIVLTIKTKYKIAGRQCESNSDVRSEVVTSNNDVIHQVKSHLAAENKAYYNLHNQLKPHSLQTIIMFPKFMITKNCSFFFAQVVYVYISGIKLASTQNPIIKSIVLYAVSIEVGQFAILFHFPQHPTAMMMVVHRNLNRDLWAVGCSNATLSSPAHHHQLQQQPATSNDFQ